jgi:hypothetical protein
MARLKEKMTISMNPEVRTLIKTAAVKLRTTSSALISQWAIAALGSGATDNLKSSSSKKKKIGTVSSTDTLTE